MLEVGAVFACASLGEVLQLHMQTAQALEKAGHKIAAAERALKRIKNQNDLNEKSDAWLMLLYNLAQVGSAIKKLDPSYKPLIDKMIKDQSDDPLLLYVFQARNSETHRLDSASEITQPTHVIQGDEKGLYAANVTIGKVSILGLTITGSSKPIAVLGNHPPVIHGRMHGINGGPATIKYFPSEIRLLDAHCRGVRYPVPFSHMGEKINPSIENVAVLAINYYKDLLNEIKRFKAKSP